MSVAINKIRQFLQGYWTGGLGKGSVKEINISTYLICERFITEYDKAKI